MTDTQTSLSCSYNDISVARQQEFLAAGFCGRHFFPHRVYHLPKCGPDGAKLAQRMCSEVNLDQLSELVLYAAPELAEEFPDELWFDSDLIWHKQQFGRTGQVATANLRAQGRDLYSMVHVSDVVQRISRRPEYRSRLENRFKGWPRMLLNAILAIALEHGFRRLFVPRSGWVLQHTDPARDVKTALFERVYDLSTEHYSPAQDGSWWVIDVGDAADRVVIPERRYETMAEEKTICICHDIERGLGHLDCDPGFASRAEREAPAYLEQMVDIERQLGIRATYNVVGCLWHQVRPVVESAGHDLAFHSHNHVIAEEQLPACRSVDYRIKGYRPPQSRITPELTNETLCHHNFEWLASSVYSLGIEKPLLRNRLTRIPILLDDFAMYDKGLTYKEWHRNTLAQIEAAPFAAIGLHDCYAGFWLHDYPELLRDLCQLGNVKTLDEVAADTLLREAGNGFDSVTNGAD